MRTSARLFAATTLGLCLAVGATAPASADDHLFNASNSRGVDQRDFANPVAGNPSGRSGQAAQPGSVPGLGDPKAGEDTGTPAFSAAALCERTAARSSGSPAFC